MLGFPTSFLSLPLERKGLRETKLLHEVCVSGRSESYRDSRLMFFLLMHSYLIDLCSQLEKFAPLRKKDEKEQRNWKWQLGKRMSGDKCFNSCVNNCFQEIEHLH